MRSVDNQTTKLSYDQTQVLEVLAIISRPNGEMCRSFKAIEWHTKQSRSVIRLCCRSLKRKGLTEFHSGLYNEDGEFAGSGYCISLNGLDRIEQDAIRGQSIIQDGDGSRQTSANV